MKTRKRILSIVLTIATLLLLVLDIPVTAAGTKKVDVLFTHDTHSHLDSFSTIVDGQQKERQSRYPGIGWRRFFHGYIDPDCI